MFAPSNGGNFSWGGRRFFLSRALDGNEISILASPTDENLVDIWFQSLRLAVIDRNRLELREAVTWGTAVQMPA